MSDFLKATASARRDFLVKASASPVFVYWICDGSAHKRKPSKIVKALDDAAVIHGLVTFRSGEGEIDGIFLAK